MKMVAATEKHECSDVTEKRQSITIEHSVNRGLLHPDPPTQLALSTLLPYIDIPSMVLGSIMEAICVLQCSKYTIQFKLDETRRGAFVDTPALMFTTLSASTLCYIGDMLQKPIFNNVGQRSTQ